VPLYFFTSFVWVFCFAYSFAVFVGGRARGISLPLLTVPRKVFASAEFGFIGDSDLVLPQ